MSAEELSRVVDKVVEKVAVRFGAIPTTIDEAWRVATIFSKSKIVPESMRERPEDVFVAMQLGAEVGLSPTNAVQTIAVINGRASIFGDGLLAVLMNSPLYVAIDEWYEVAGKRVESLTDDDLKDPTTVAVCAFWRRGVEAPTIRRFSIADARRAKLINKPGPWQEYPARMLRLRARSFAARDLFPDVLKGLAAGEEMTDTPPPAPPPHVRRLSETATIVTPPPPIPVPPDPIVTLDPASIAAAIDHTIKLSSGFVLEVMHDDDLVALDAYVGTATLIKCTVERADGEMWRLLSWNLADDDAPEVDA